MWKAATDVSAPAPAEADDWETDPDFVNDVSEHEQRWGPGGRNVEAIDMAKLREEVLEADKLAKEKQYEEGPKPSFGYGGKFGVQADRMDKSAVGHDYVGKTEKHVSQKDYAQGFGGKFGVQTDRMDKSAVGHDYVGKVEKHVSQTDYAQGFGGKYGVQTDRVDKSAAGWEDREQVEKHSSQKDYSVGFGGKFGVQTDRKDASAVGWDHHEESQQHDSQKDYAIGFGGKYGVQTDRQDASAVGWEHQEKTPAHASQVDHKKIESMAKTTALAAALLSALEDVVATKEAFMAVITQSKLNCERSAEEVCAAADAYVALCRDAVDEMKAAATTSATEGFGGKFGIETDRVDKSAHTFDNVEKVGNVYTSPKPDIPPAATSSIRAKFENMAKEKEEEAMQAVSRRQQADKVTKKPKSTELQTSQTSPEEAVKESPWKEDRIRKEPKLSNKSPKVDPAAGGVPSPLKSLTNDKDVKSPNMPDVTLGGPNDKDEMMPTVVVSPCGWGSESTDTDTDEEEGTYTARALFDYQATAADEISFDPEDIITNIVMVDEGWWQGLCKGQFGLFPANYVQLLDK